MPAHGVSSFLLPQRGDDSESTFARFCDGKFPGTSAPSRDGPSFSRKTSSVYSQNYVNVSRISRLRETASMLRRTTDIDPHRIGFISQPNFTFYLLSAFPLRENYLTIHLFKESTCFLRPIRRHSQDLQFCLLINSKQESFNLEGVSAESFNLSVTKISQDCCLSYMKCKRNAGTRSILIRLVARRKISALELPF